MTHIQCYNKRFPFTQKLKWWLKFQYIQNYVQFLCNTVMKEQ